MDLYRVKFDKCLKEILLDEHLLAEIQSVLVLANSLFEVIEKVEAYPIYIKYFEARKAYVASLGEDKGQWVSPIVSIERINEYAEPVIM